MQEAVLNTRREWTALLNAQPGVTLRAEGWLHQRQARVPVPWVLQGASALF